MCLPFCIKCGHKLPSEAAFCPNCGTPIVPSTRIMGDSSKIEKLASSKPKRTRAKRYICSICGKELKGKDLKFARGRRQAFSAHSRKVSPKAKELWKRSLSAVFCEKCISESDKWDKKHKVCINCEYFALNIVRLPNVPEIYCMASTGDRSIPIKKIRNPLKEKCEKWFARRPL